MKLWNARRPLGRCKNGRWITDSKNGENVHLWAHDRRGAEIVARQYWEDNNSDIVVRCHRLAWNIALCNIPSEPYIFSSKDHYRGTGLHVSGGNYG